MLTPLANEALGRELLLPARRPADLDQLLEEVPGLRWLVIDGAERPIRCPKDKQRRKDDYSGKKKAHRKKNLLICSEKRVVYLAAWPPPSRWCCWAQPPYRSLYLHPCTDPTCLPARRSGLSSRRAAPERTFL